jgi:UDP-galactopyranose mutase
MTAGDEMKFDVLVAGCGFAGAVSARQLAESGKRVLIIERRSHIGGNCHDQKNEHNILIHTYGPHLFHTNNKAVWEFLSRFTEWDIYQHRVLALIDGKKAPVPFNLNALQQLFPRELAQRLEEKLLAQFPYNTKVPILELRKSTDPDLQFLAGYIYDKIFVQYTAKQWGMKPEEMDSAVTARVPVFVGRDDRYFNDAYQGVPRRGYTRLFETLLDHPNISLMLQADFARVCAFDDDAFYFLGQKFEGHLIYTGQIDELFDYRFGELPYRSIHWSLETLDQERYQEVATVNYPNDYTFTRITEFKHIHPVASAKTTILKEFPQPYERGKNEPYYPIFTDENRKCYDQYVQHASRYANLTLLGRLAEYKYYDMDDIVERALQVSADLCNG